MSVSPAPAPLRIAAVDPGLSSLGVALLGLDAVPLDGQNESPVVLPTINGAVLDTQLKDCPLFKISEELVKHHLTPQTRGTFCTGQLGWWLFQADKILIEQPMIMPGTAKTNPNALKCIVLVTTIQAWAAQRKIHVELIGSAYVKSILCAWSSRKLPYARRKQMAVMLARAIVQRGSERHLVGPGVVDRFKPGLVASAATRGPNKLDDLSDALIILLLHECMRQWREPGVTVLTSDLCKKVMRCTNLLDLAENHTATEDVADLTPALVTALGSESRVASLPSARETEELFTPNCRVLGCWLIERISELYAPYILSDLSVRRETDFYDTDLDGIFGDDDDTSTESDTNDEGFAPVGKRARDGAPKRPHQPKPRA